MKPPMSRRQFSLSTMAAAGAVLGNSMLSIAAPPGSSEPKVSTKPYPPLAVTPIREAFEDRYADLGGVLDLTNGVVWGYEPYGSLVNYGAGFQGDVYKGVHQSYLDILALRATSGTPEENAVFAEAFEIASERSWRWPTVFEARDAVEKGLFTFGDGGLNLYYGSPLYELPGVAYYLTTLRWTSSVAKPNYAHVWSAADGGTMVAGLLSHCLGIVVSRLS